MKGLGFGFLGLEAEIRINIVDALKGIMGDMKGV